MLVVVRPTRSRRKGRKKKSVHAARTCRLDARPLAEYIRERVPRRAHYTTRREGSVFLVPSYFSPSFARTYCLARSVQVCRSDNKGRQIAARTREAGVERKGVFNTIPELDGYFITRYRNRLAINASASVNRNRS